MSSLDYTHELCICIQKETTVTESSHSTSFVLSEVLMDAISAWQCIKNDDVARRVGKNIQERIDKMLV
jgi:hypothetical protein